MTDEDQTVALVAPAKINLALHVTGQRPDGYHLIETLAVFTEHGDRITATPSQHDRFEIDGPFGAQLAAEASNLVLKARDALREAHGATLPPVAIGLEKRLPLASGVGGGSSDAAATLKALNRLWNLNLDAARLAAIGARIGADLPMCLEGRPLLASGVGDIVEPLDDFPGFGLVLVNPGQAVNTREVFEGLAKKDHFGLPTAQGITELDDLLRWLAETRNDLEEPAGQIAPGIGQARDALTLNGALFARMSGSGATCFGIYRDLGEASLAAEAIRTQWPGWFVLETQTAPSETWI